MSKSAWGFTIIELLVVLAIIGLLAIAMLAAINPLEQMKKAKDERRLADARELLTAYDRYFTTYAHFPWQESGVDPAQVPGVGTAQLPTFSGATDNSFALVESREVSRVFPQRISIKANELWISVSINGNQSVCFEPESKSARSGAMAPLKTQANTYPSPTHDCHLPYGTSSQCYVCIPF